MKRHVRKGEIRLPNLAQLFEYSFWYKQNIRMARQIKQSLFVQNTFLRIKKLQYIEK